jgi:hypothetical protein
MSTVNLNKKFEKKNVECINGLTLSVMSAIVCQVCHASVPGSFCHVWVPGAGRW